VDAGKLRYTPAANYSGADSFSYTVADGNGGFILPDFLPAFDEYLVAYTDREQGILGPAVIVDGRIAGTWKCKFDNKTVTIFFSPLRSLNNSPLAAIATAADRYAAFVGLAVQFVY